MSEYLVTATLLNLRTSPSSQFNNVITRLKKDEVVDVVDASSADWYKINTTGRMPLVSGYASSSFLQKKTAEPGSQTSYLQPVHLPSDPRSKRNFHGAWQYPLSEENMPQVNTAASIQEKTASMHTIIAYLAVDKSARYQREAVHTYCNIYAYDYCYLGGAFLPRVWWMDKALLALQQGTPVAPRYGITVQELNANMLYAWLEEWGTEFSWQRTYDLDLLQSKVNEGRTGIICGPNKNPAGSGHICCVVPERENRTAARQNGKVVCPLLSQAGAVNLPFYNNNRWWFLPQIREFGFWYME